MNSATKNGPRFRIGDWVAFQYGPKKVSAKVLEDRGPLGVRGQRLYRVLLDDDAEAGSAFEMPENELDRAVPPARQSFYIRYLRQGATNTWLAKTEMGKLLQGVTTKGAVSYSGALWEGEAAEDQREATVLVLLGIDELAAERDPERNSELFRNLVQSAQRLADEMFLSRHPRARIRHSHSGD